MNQSKKCSNSKFGDQLQCVHFSHFPAEFKNTYKAFGFQLPARHSKKMEVLLLFIRNNDGFLRLLSIGK